MSVGPERIGSNDLWVRRQSHRDLTKSSDLFNCIVFCWVVILPTRASHIGYFTDQKYRPGASGRPSPRPQRTLVTLGCSRRLERRQPRVGTHPTVSGRERNAKREFTQTQLLDNEMRSDFWWPQIYAPESDCNRPNSMQEKDGLDRTGVFTGENPLGLEPPFCSPTLGSALGCRRAPRAPALGGAGPGGATARGI
jgi:hypothetical protein